VFELTEGNAAAFLRSRGVLGPDAAVQVSALGGGISNVVLRVLTPDDCLVLKQPLAKLRVASDWPFDRERVLGEHRCMAYLGDVLRPGEVPQARYFDPETYVLVMSCAPPGGRLWKEALLAGDIEVGAAELAGNQLGRIHGLALRDAPMLREAFANQTVLVQGRVDPYHRTTADRHPELVEPIRAEVERLLATRRTLTLGDYCPKNSFVYADRILALDFEVAHWGDPGFDTAFCLNHLLLKALRFREWSGSYVAAARGFWSSYAGVAPGVEETELATARELGVLMLARIDGKSPVEYITDEPTKALVRETAARLITARPDRLDAVFGQVEQALLDGEVVR
jgi:5-methylthioribose kinase